MSNRIATDINVIALIKGGERYVILYDDSQRAMAMRQLGNWAANEELLFTWYDAAVLASKIREEARKI